MASKKETNENSMIMKTDIKLCINRMTRRVNKAIYYNKECQCLFMGQELDTISSILNVLYERHLDYKEMGKNDTLGIIWKDLIELVPHSKASIRLQIWKLIPQFIDIKSKRFKRKYRFYKLNKYGVMLVEKLQDVQREQTKDTGTA